MRILHLNDRLSRRGGADLHLLGIIEELSDVAEQCLAFGRQDKGLSLEIETRLVKGLDARTEQPCDLVDLIESFAPDIIHVHNVMNPSALHQATLEGAVMTVQDHRTFCPGRGKQKLDTNVCEEALNETLCSECFTDDDYFNGIWKLTQSRLNQLKMMRVVLVLSNYMKDELTLAGVDPGRIRVIPPFVHGLDSKKDSDLNPCVLHVGRLVATKGVEDVIKAWELADTGLPLVIAGAGPERAKLERPNIEWVGWVGPEELAKLYKSAKALLLAPRWQEPYGIVGLEAKFFQLPVVAWKSGGIAEWNPEVLVPWGDLDGLAAGLKRVVSGSNKSTGYNDNQRHENMAKLIEIYRAL